MKPLLASLALISLTSALPCAAQTNAAQANNSSKSLQALALQLNQAGSQAHHRAIVPQRQASVELQTEFIIAKSSDVDDVGINFDLLPLMPRLDPSSDEAQHSPSLQYAIGYPVTLLYQKLSQTTPMMAMTIRKYSASVVTTPDNVPVTIAVDGTVPDFSQSIFGDALPLPLPQVEHVLHIQGSLTLTPHINADRSITLGFFVPSDLGARQPATGQTFTLRPIASGGVLVISSFRPPLGKSITLGSVNLLKYLMTMLIFVTPTIAVNKK